MAKVKDTQSFIAAARAVHGDRYDYSQAVFAGAQSPITIVCPNCGPFQLKQAESHYRKSKRCGCRACERRDQLERAGRLHICTDCGQWAKYRSPSGRCKECHEKQNSVRLAKVAAKKADAAAKPKREILEKRFCVNCGKPTTKQSTRCWNCFLKESQLASEARAERLLADAELRRQRSQLRKIRKNINKRIAESRALPIAGIVSHCRDCGQKIVDSKVRKYCSINCKWRAMRRLRRARKNESYVEAVDLLEVAKRDKWICQLCGKKVKPNASYKRQATLDHVIPISKGGLHEMSNCQLAHFDCNSSKHDKIETLF